MKLPAGVVGPSKKKESPFSTLSVALSLSLPDCLLSVSLFLSPSDVVKREPSRDPFLQERFRDAKVSQARLLQVEGVAQLLDGGLRVERLDVAVKLGVDRLHAPTWGASTDQSTEAKDTEKC